MPQLDKLYGKSLSRQIGHLQELPLTWVSVSSPVTRHFMHTGGPSPMITSPRLYGSLNNGRQSVRPDNVLQA